VTSIVFTSLFLGLVLGSHPVGVAVEGPAAAVAFELDGKPVGRAAREPWSLDVEFGSEIAPHELVARALDAGGRELARARQWLNVPRPPAEASILIERDPKGRAVAARLTWQSLLGTAPRRISVTFDGKPLDAANPARIALPESTDDATHLVSAEVEFSPAVVSRAGVVLGGRSRSEATSELTGVPVRASPGTALPPPAALHGWFRKSGEVLHVVAVEKGPALLLVVRDTDHAESLARFGSGGKTSFTARGMRGSMPQYDPDYSRFETRLADADRVRFIWPRAKRAPGAEVPTDLFDASRDFTGDFAGLHWLLTRISHPIPKGGDLRFADAVAVAGIQAYSGYTRRAVVLALGARVDDASRFPPAVVRAYLQRIHVPLLVWSVDPRTAERVAARWGEVEDVTSYPKLKAAFERLRASLDAQQMVWIEGRHLPQDIALSGEAKGIEILR
jgi:hypothetical protein